MRPKCLVIGLIPKERIVGTGDRFDMVDMLGRHARHYYDLFCLAERPEIVAMLRSAEYAAINADYDRIAAPEELQRYSDYAGKIGYLLERFDSSADPAEKLDLMAEMERPALEELKGFLRAHIEARFVL